MNRMRGLPANMMNISQCWAAGQREPHIIPTNSTTKRSGERQQCRLLLPTDAKLMANDCKTEENIQEKLQKIYFILISCAYEGILHKLTINANITI